MKFSIAAITLSLSTLVLSYTVADFPACALSCFTKAVTQTTCAASDYKCLCTTGRDAVTASVGPCLISNCNTEDASQGLVVEESICAQATGAASSVASTISLAQLSSASSTTGLIASTADSAPLTVTTNGGKWMRSDMLGAGFGMFAAGIMVL